MVMGRFRLARDVRLEYWVICVDSAISENIVRNKQNYVCHNTTFNKIVIIKINCSFVLSNMVKRPQIEIQ